MQKVAIRPGVNVDFTPTLNQGGWSAGNLIRFKDGLAQKYGGWQRLSQSTFVGTVRGLHAWADLVGRPYLVGGSEQRLMVFTNGQLIDITPIRVTHNVAVDFSTVINTRTVTIVDAAHGATAGDWVDVVVVVSVGGLLIQGLYQVQTVVNANSYTITAASNATATVNNAGAVPVFDTVIATPTVTVTLAAHGLATGGLFNVTVSTTVGGLTMLGTYAVTFVSATQFTILPGGNATGTNTGSENGGNARFQYLIPTGYASATLASGYGVGIYGTGLYGTGTGTTLVALRSWYLDNFGANAVGNYNGSTLYQWAPPATVYAGTSIATNQAAAVTNAPLYMTASFVSNPQQMVISLGAETVGTQDPLLVRWCDAGVITTWTASSTNQAGSFRLSTGSRIVGGIVSPNQNLIWTDLDLWVMQYMGLPFVWGFQKIATECGLISGHAMGVLGQRTFWMGTSNFFTAGGGGGVEILPCLIWDQVFKNISPQQTDKIFCAVNSLFQEVAWFFPSLGGTGEIDSYAKYNAQDKAWDYGSLTRFSWIDENVFGQPIGIDSNNLMQQHDIPGVVDADGAVMGESIQTGYFDLGEGEDFIFMERLIPDFIWSGSPQQLQITVYVLEYPSDEDNNLTVTYGPFTVTNTTPIVLVRGRGRQVSIKISGMGVGTFWRIGAMRHNGRPDGKR